MKSAEYLPCSRDRGSQVLCGQGHSDESEGEVR